MRQAITAVYENGMFIPTTKVDLPEHTTVMTAIAEKVSALATEKYLNTMAAKGSVQVFDSVMAKVKNRSPLPGDEL